MEHYWKVKKEVEELLRSEDSVPLDSEEEGEVEEQLQSEDLIPTIESEEESFVLGRVESVV